jgi:hypothetical protein
VPSPLVKAMPAVFPTSHPEMSVADGAHSTRVSWPGSGRNPDPLSAMTCPSVRPVVTLAVAVESADAGFPAHNTEVASKAATATIETV